MNSTAILSQRAINYAITRPVIAALLLISCAAAFAQTDIQKIQNAAWFEREIAQGVKWKFYKFDDLFSSKQEIHVTTVDMNVTNTQLKLLSMPPGQRAVPSTFATQNANSAAVINGNFTNTSPPYNASQHLRIDGVVLYETLPAVQDEGAVIIDSSGFATTVLRPGSGNWNDRLEPNVMASNVPLRSGGAHYPLPNETFYTTDRHPRTCIGKTADNKLLFVVVDGRRPDAAGMTFLELRTLFQALNCDNALNLDGGGSSAMWVKGALNNGIVNVPSDGSQRLVPNALTILADASTTTLPYDARHVSTSSYNATMVAGSSQTITMSFSNFGTTAWGAGTVLKTTEQRDRTSAFVTAGDWVSASNAGGLNQASVAQDATGSFTFTITAPNVSQVTAYTESFGVWDAAGGWVGPEQNRLNITVLPPGGLAGNVIVESRSGGKNSAWYTEIGAFADNSTNCTAPGLTGNIGMRYGSTYLSVAGSKRAQFKPFVNAGRYKVYVAWGAAGSRRANITYIVNHAGGQSSQLLDQSAVANTWVLLGEYDFLDGNAGYVEVNNSATNVSGSMYTAGAMWEPVPPASVTDWSMY